MRVVFYHRKPPEAYFSIENYFRFVRAELPPDIESEVATCRFASKGILPRVYSLIEASGRQGDINHITGDVHFLTLSLAKFRTVLTIHDCGPLYRVKGLKREVLRQLWFSIPARRVAAITAVSNATKTDILRFVDCDPSLISVIPTCISPSFVPIAKEFDERSPRVLQIGTTENKNIERVAEALRGIKCSYEIVGDLTHEQRLALERFKIDYRCTSRLTDEEVRAKYEACDVVMFASTSEGFGMPIIEGNATGRPVITSNVTSMPEVAADAACLVDPYDPESIRAGFLRVVSDPSYRATLVERGFQNQRRYSARGVARAYYELYKRIAKA